MNQTEPHTHDPPTSLQHAFRISLNQTRRVVRRVIEIDLAKQTASGFSVPSYPHFMLNKDADFMLTLRMLRRVVRHLLDQNSPLAALA